MTVTALHTPAYDRLETEGRPFSEMEQAANRVFLLQEAYRIQREIKAFSNMALSQGLDVSEPVRKMNEQCYELIGVVFPKKEG